MRRILLLAICLIAAVTVSAQIPGPNVNMVTGKVFPGGDPWLQKQNEPSGAVSTKNPCHLLAGANDYRAVNVAGLPGDKEIGDAWVGWYTSINCGQTWYSTLVPGYPQDTSPAGKSSPVYGLTTAADPTIRAGAGGFFAYSFIAFNRGSNVGKLAVARFVDRNTTEIVTKAESAISYIDTKSWDNGSAGNYIDKPTLLITQGTGTCTVTTAAGKIVTIPASTVHLAWTVFVGNSDDVIRTKVYYARSSNCGTSLDGPPTKLSEGYAVTQSANIAQASNGAIYVVWRQFSTVKGDPNQLLVAKSTDGGKSFTKGSPVPMPLSFLPFDQGTSRKTFRTNAFAATAADLFGRLYVAVAVRGYANANQSRVVVMNTLDGVTWNGPFAIDNDPNASGHQIMPAMTAVGGKLNVVWLDFHDDVSGKFGYGLFDTFIKEVYPVRHSMDVRGAQAILQPSGALNWTKYGILQDAVPQATVPRISKYLIGDYDDANGDHFFKQLQFNRSNLKLYAGGTVPFIGDFIDVAGLAYLAQQNGVTTTWLPNNGLDPLAFSTAAQTFHAFWTDNRDAKVGTFPAEPDTEAEEGTPLAYMAPGTTACTGVNPPTKTRNANVYTARIAPGLFVAAPTNSKPSIVSNNPANRIVRAFPVFVQNNTGSLKTFRLTIVPPAQFPAAGIATFQPIPQDPIPSPLPAPVLTVDAMVPAKSSITRTVSVVSTIKYPQIRVNVVELNSTDPLTGSAIINADIENADIENADIENADIENQEIHNADIENADIENADIENADIENADIENADIENADIENADIENADIENADIENADIENADIENADIENGAMTDFSVDLDNTGNTASSYQVKFAVGNAGGYIFQLIGRRPYKTPSAHGCEQIEKTTNQILFNIPNPDVSAGPLPDPTSPAAGSAANATILVGPREKLKLTLRVFDKDGVNNRQGGDGLIKPFCPIVDLNGANCSVVTNPVTVIVRAAAPNTGDNVAFEEVVTTNPEGAVNITTTTVPPQPSVGMPYSEALQATGGLGTYAWTVQSGTLPPGLSLSPAGVLFGTPTTIGVFSFVVFATDGIQSDTQAFTVRVAAITTASVPGAIVGSLYGPRTLQHAGLTGGPFTWTVVSGSLPSGVTLNGTTGTLGGVATTPGVSDFVVQVADAAANIARKAFTITAMTIDAGDLVVADGTPFTTTGKLYRVTPGGSVSLIAAIDGGAAKVAQDRNSFVVADRTNNRILRVTPANVETVFTAPPGVAGYIAVAVTHAGDIIIGDNAADKVYKLSGGTLTTLGNLPLSPTELQNVDIAVEPDGGVMIADDTSAGTVQLVHFDAAGVQSPTVATTVASAGAIALHSSGDFLLADYTGQRIVQVTSAGAVVSSLSVTGIGTSIVGLALDFDEAMYAISGFVAVRRIATTGSFTTVTAGSPFVFMNDLVHFRPVNTFEFFVDGTAACTSCAVTDAFAALGTTFSFVTSINPDVTTNVQLSGPNLFDRPSDGSNHSITAPGTIGGWFTGTMTITTATNPRTVMFRVQGNNDAETFPISALDTQNNGIENIQRRNVITYPAGDNVGREETIVITSPVGISTITVDMPAGGFILFIDDLVITSPPPPVIILN